MDFVAKEGVVRTWTGAIVAVFCSDWVLGLDRRMWFPLLFYFRTGDFSTNVVRPWSWDFITVELAGVSEVGLLAYGLDLFLLLRPGESDVVVAGRRRIQFLLSLVDEVEVGLLGGTARLEGGLLHPHCL